MFFPHPIVQFTSTVQYIVVQCGAVMYNFVRYAKVSILQCSIVKYSTI